MYIVYRLKLDRLGAIFCFFVARPLLQYYFYTLVSCNCRQYYGVPHIFTLLFLLGDRSEKYKSTTISVEGQQRHLYRQKVPISIWMRWMEEIIGFDEKCEIS